MTGSTEHRAWLPRRSLRRLHFPALVDRLWHDLVAALERPVERRIVDGRVVVDVLRQARVQREPDGSLRVLLRGAADQSRWIPVDGHSVIVDHMPAKFVWLNRWIDLGSTRIAGHAHALGIEHTPQELGAYADDLRRHFTRLVRRHGDMRRVRATVADALELDADTLRLARRVDIGRASFRGARVAEYNAARRHRAALLDLEREMPQLVPLYALIADRADFEPIEGQPAQAVRRFLCQHGLGGRTWRLLCRSGRRLFLPVGSFYPGATGDCMLDYLRALDGLGCRGEPPRAVIEAILASHGGPGGSRTTYLAHVRTHGHAFRHVMRTICHLAPALQAQARSQLGPVLQWLADEPPVLDKAQRRAGWDWLVDKAHAWRQKRDREAALSDTVYPVPFERWTVDACELLAIGSRAGLRKEGEAMRHCIEDCHYLCEAGHAVAVSVRCRRTGRRLASALLRNDSLGGWYCEEVRAFANGHPGPTVEWALEVAVARLKAAAAGTVAAARGGERDRAVARLS